MVNKTLLVQKSGMAKKNGIDYKEWYESVAKINNAAEMKR